MLERKNFSGRMATVAHISPHLLKAVFDDGDIVFLTPATDSIRDFDPDEPRDPQGRWTIGGAVGSSSGEEFVSPNIGHLDFDGAVKALEGKRHALYKYAAHAVDVATEIDPETSDRDVVGAWSDGAENSTMTVTPKVDHETLRLNAAMKGYLAAQKSVLIFDDAPAGKHSLYQFQLPGDLSKAHQQLLDAGVSFHTLLPHDGKSDVVVVDLDGSARSGIEKLGVNAKVTHGTAEFIGTTKEDGTDNEQRADARKQYQDLIDHSRSKARGVWPKLRDRWDARLAKVTDARLDDYSPDQPRGKTTPESTPGSFSAEGWAGEPLVGSHGDPALVSTALTTAKGRSKAEREQVRQESYNYQRVDLDQAKKDPELFAGMVNTFRNAAIFPYMRASDFNGDADHDARAVIDRMKSNLGVLWNSTSQANKDSWRHWYVGAHNMIGDRMKQYLSVGRPAMTGVYASLSPNTQWDVNVHLGDRLLDTVFHSGDDKWDKGMADAAQGQLERAAVTVSKAKNQERSQANFDAMRQTFGEVKKAGNYNKQTDDYHRAAWIKLWNDAHDESPVLRVGIDGKMGAPIKNKGLDDNGEPADMSGAFGPLPRIENAIKVLRSNGNIREISDALGDRHKVRSFYNNILDPHSANDDVTIDTHAAGAAWLDPLGGDSSAIGQMFGSSVQKGDPSAPRSNRIGVQGTYPLYAQAYREFAEEAKLDRGRELQSIIWKHKIALFKGATEAKKRAIKEAWKSFHDNQNVTLEQTQKKILDIVRAD